LAADVFLVPAERPLTFVAVAPSDWTPVDPMAREC
jgi:hypothetical protein